MRRFVFATAVLLLCVGTPAAVAQTADSAATVIPLGDIPGPERAGDGIEVIDVPPSPHSPATALRRAAVIPGWGQVYNRQYYKLPFVYAGLGGIGFLAYRSNHDYLIFRRAALYATYKDVADEKRPPQYREAYGAEYDEALSLICNGDAGCVERQKARGAEVGRSLRDQRDIFRRNRDLSYLGVGLFYGLTVLDAYVSAHLLDFDVGEDLTVSLRPVPRGAALAVRWSL